MQKLRLSKLLLQRNSFLDLIVGVRTEAKFELFAVISVIVIGVSYRRSCPGRSRIWSLHNIACLT